MEVPAGLYDILWRQGAWLQVPEKRDFAQRWSGCLVEGGRIAFEHACLARPAREAPEEKPAPEKALGMYRQVFDRTLAAACICLSDDVMKAAFNKMTARLGHSEDPWELALQREFNRVMQQQAEG